MRGRMGKRLECGMRGAPHHGVAAWCGTVVAEMPPWGRGELFHTGGSGGRDKVMEKLVKGTCSRNYWRTRGTESGGERSTSVRTGVTGRTTEHNNYRCTFPSTQRTAAGHATKQRGLGTNVASLLSHVQMLSRHHDRGQQLLYSQQQLLYSR